MLCAIMLSVIMLNLDMLSVSLLSALVADKAKVIVKIQVEVCQL